MRGLGEALWFSIPYRCNTEMCKHAVPASVSGFLLFVASTTVCAQQDLLCESHFVRFEQLDDDTFTPPERDDQGVLRHNVRSRLQTGETEIRVLLPDGVVQKTNGGTGQRQHPVIYVLPVERQGDARYGDGLEEVRKLDLHNKHRAIFIAPSFSALPWYADHPRDASLRQESYIVDVVVPFVERTYPAQAEPQGRLLLGFSKSGWGAWSLLLRHRDLFGRAAAWDAPLAMQQSGKYGSGPIFGTQQNFEQYRITDLLRSQADALRVRPEQHVEPRLILMGYGNFSGDHKQVHELLDMLDVSHVYRDGPRRKHDWHSGWVAEAVELLGRSNPPLVVGDALIHDAHGSQLGGVLA